MSEQQTVTLHPIGRVVQGRVWGQQGDAWQEQAAEIEIDEAWAGALADIEGFSHIWVVWWLDRFQSPPESLRVRPEGRPEMPLVGIFATRSPHRPNPIALTAVRLLEHQGARLRVQGLDACQGTPILDIKPYLCRGDQIPEATAPDWLEQLWSMHDGERET